MFDSIKLNLLLQQNKTWSTLLYNGGSKKKHKNKVVEYYLIQKMIWAHNGRSKNNLILMINPKNKKTNEKYWVCLYWWIKTHIYPITRP